MSTAAAAVDKYETPLTPESWGKLGMWIFLAGDAMSFGGLLAGYGALRIAAGDKWPSPADTLGIPLTAFMTFVLICSSVTMVKALSAIRHGDMKKFKLFMAATVFGGVFFLGCQYYEWSHLMKGPDGVFGNADDITATRFPGEGMTANFGATFYTLTGFHGMHVTGGVIYLGVLLILGMMGRLTPAHGDQVEIAGLYWHFVDLIWILVFTFVYLL